MIDYVRFIYRILNFAMASYIALLECWCLFYQVEYFEKPPNVIVMSFAPFFEI